MLTCNVDSIFSAHMRSKKKSLLEIHDPSDMYAGWSWANSLIFSRFYEQFKMIISPVKMYYQEWNDDQAMMMFIDYMCKLEQIFF